MCVAATVCRGVESYFTLAVSCDPEFSIKPKIHSSNALNYLSFSSYNYCFKLAPLSFSSKLLPESLAERSVPFDGDVTDEALTHHEEKNDSKLAYI